MADIALNRLGDLPVLKGGGTFASFKGGEEVSWEFYGFYC